METIYSSNDTPDEVLLIKNNIDINFIRKVFPATENLSEDEFVQYYLQSAWKDGIDPNPEFSSSFYLNEYSDVRVEDINPLAHYMAFGAQEGRVSFLSQWGDPTSEKFTTEQLDTIIDAFDASYYREYAPELACLSDRALASHYLVKGWRQNLNPSRSFSTEDYLAINQDVAEANINPLLHFVLHGPIENRLTSIPPSEDSSNQIDLSQFDEEIQDANFLADVESVRKYFNTEFYRMTNPDLSGSDLELIYHFMKVGWKELRDPNPEFSVSYYLDNYQDISQSNSNPFLHYVIFGKHEGRKTRGDEPLRLLNNPQASITPRNLLAVVWSQTKNQVPALPPKLADPDKLSIHWIIPDFSKGSGGHMTIFRMVRFLELFGHKCKIWIESPTMHLSPEGAWEDIVKYFQCVSAEVDFVENGLFESSGDAVIATGWSTAYLADKLKGFTEKFYFVQDHELEFYPTGSEYLLARQTYGFDLACICASPWLSKLMTNEYGRWARHFDLAYEPSIYKITDEKTQSSLLPSPSGTLKIAVYARDHTARRCVSLALIALEELGRRRQDFEVHFFGQEVLQFNEANFNSLNHGILDAQKLADLYNKCHLGICFSATNYSLVPQEMMACGLPIVELNSNSTNDIFPKGTVTLAGPDPFDIADAIDRLMNDPNERRAQSEAALSWVETFSWEKSARTVEAALKERLNLEAENISTPTVLKTRTVRLDVVIPTFNGINEVKPVIGALRRQRAFDEIQIHCIDSSSSDGTLEWLKDQSDISLTVIPQAEFQHGRTRNVGAAQGTGELIAFLTQDAIPANDIWASDILMMMDHSPSAAGLFGRHLPYPDHPLIVREEIENHFANMLKYPLQLSKTTDNKKWLEGDLGWRMLLHYYSDNNSAMRRNIWNEIPYPEVDYGEDQIWAREIVDHGYTKIYAPTVCVYHSHDYTPEENYKRAKIEGGFFYKHFGYKLGFETEDELAEGVKAEQRNFSMWAQKHKVGDEFKTLGIRNIAEKHRGLRDGRLMAMQE